MDKVSKILLIIAHFFLLIVLWDWIALRLENQNLFPSPSYIVNHSLASFNQSNMPSTPVTGILYLLWHAYKTCLRVVISSSLGILAGLILGLLAYASLSANPVVNTLFKITRGIPLLALVPLFTLWFGDSEIFGVLGYISYAITVIVASDSYSVTCSLPENLIEMSKLANAKKTVVLRKLVFPAILYKLNASISAVIGLAWAFAVGAELIVKKGGLGHLLQQSQLQFDIGRMVILGITYANLGWLSTWLFSTILKRVQSRACY